ncbi:MAG: GNAT family N-acetyltransferase [Gemmatimonadota bacterium]
MPRREVTVQGPLQATPRDIEEINRVFSGAFTERYHRDGMAGVKVPTLNPTVWRYAIADAADGALLWRDDLGHLAAFNMIHRSGVEGWMGPLAVRTDCQGSGVGKGIVREGIARLKEAGAKTIGLETMPRTIENIGFYSALGLRPGHLTVTMAWDVYPGEDRPAPGGTVPDWAEASRAAGELAERLSPGVDFSREFALTEEASLGGVTVIQAGAGADAFALWHTVALAEARTGDELRVLKLGATNERSFTALMLKLQEEALSRRLRRVSVRSQTAYDWAFGLLLKIGFRVHWTDLRMTLAGYEERLVRDGVVWSNWEI